MTKPLAALFFPLAAFMPAALACQMLLALPSVAADGSSSGSSGSSGKQTPLLHSAVEDRERMHNSVKVLVAPPSKPKPKQFNLGSQVHQLSGSQAYTPGTTAPAVPKPVVHSLGAQNFGGQMGPRFPIAAPMPRGQVPLLPAPVPKWNYTATPRNGIMSWTPGYGTAILPQRRFANTNASINRGNALLSSPRTSALLSQPRTSALLAQPRTNAQLSSTQTSATLRNKELSGTRLQLPPPQQLKARQMALPEKHAAPPASWEQWYQRVAKAMYGQWQQNAVGPGSSTLLITVYRGHDVDCKVISFEEAPGADRNATQESIFREASLKAVSSLNGDGVWEFPLSKNPPKKVTFDMQFKHAVGETQGCKVIHMHDDSSMKSFQ